MDQNTLVEGGDEGIRRIAKAFRDRDFPIEASYLVRRRAFESDDPEWVVVFVVSPFRPSTDRDFIYAHVELRRAGLLPFIDPQVRLEVVSPDHIEASRLLAYARRIGAAPLVLRNVGTQGLLIDYAIVAEDRGNQARAA